MTDSTTTAQDAAATITDDAGQAVADALNAQTTPPTGVPPAGDRGNQDTTTGGDDPDPDPDADATPDRGKKIETLDDALKVIADLRAENARTRTNAKTAAADEARAQIAADIAKALGVVPGDPEDEAVDPATQVQALTAQVEEETRTAREAVRDLAIYKAAGKVGANPTALLDSRSFLNTLTDLDPTDTTTVEQAVTDAITANPHFKAKAQAAGPTTIDHAPGGHGHTQPLSLGDAVQQAYRR